LVSEVDLFGFKFDLDVVGHYRVDMGDTFTVLTAGKVTGVLVSCFFNEIAEVIFHDGQVLFQSCPHLMPNHFAELVSRFSAKFQVFVSEDASIRVE